MIVEEQDICMTMKQSRLRTEAGKRTALRDGIYKKYRGMQQWNDAMIKVERKLTTG